MKVEKTLKLYLWIDVEFGGTGAWGKIWAN